MPGGDTRTTTNYKPYPLTLKRGEGPFLWDIDGNKYIDLLGNYTSLVHGNAYPPIVEAATKAVKRRQLVAGAIGGADSSWRRCCANASSRSSACDSAIQGPRPGCSRRTSRGASPAAS